MSRKQRCCFPVSARSARSTKLWLSKTYTIFYRSEEHTSELQSLRHLVCRLLLEKKKKFRNHLQVHYKKSYLFATMILTSISRPISCSSKINSVNLRLPAIDINDRLAIQSLRTHH